MSRDDILGFVVLAVIFVRMVEELISKQDEIISI